LFVQEYVRSSCVSGHRFVNLVHKHSYGFVHPKPNTLFHLIPARRHSQTVVTNSLARDFSKSGSTVCIFSKIGWFIFACLKNFFSDSWTIKSCGDAGGKLHFQTSKSFKT
jgi:hypothetical protein